MRVVHLTSVHAWNDTRIFLKMCRSLALAGHEVHLVAPRADASGPEIREGVTVHPVPPARGRLQRMSETVPVAVKQAVRIQGDLYHFHDPEFLRYAPALQRRTRKPVIYDAHEDLRTDVLDKPWIPAWARPLVGRWAGRMEDKTVRRLAGVIAATPSIACRFAGHPRAVLVRNFPLKDELRDPLEGAERHVGRFVHLGGISALRGIREIIAALPKAGQEVRLALIGKWESQALREECRRLAGWAQVEELGVLDRGDVRRCLQCAQVGVVLYQPIRSHLEAYPTKMFEYMSAGVPVIASDFPVWQTIVGDGERGLLVDPRDTEAISRTMRWMVEHAPEAASMGRRAREAVETCFNWEREFETLRQFYAQLAQDYRADQAGPSATW